MKIYVINRGPHYLRETCAAATDPERAELLRRAASCEDGGEAYIEEFEDDFDLIPMHGRLYSVVWKELVGVRFEDIEVYPSMLDEEEEFGLNPDEFVEMGKNVLFNGDKRIGNVVVQDYGKTKYYNTLVVAKTAEEAEEMGIEIIQQYRDKELGL